MHFATANNVVCAPATFVSYGNCSYYGRHVSRRERQLLEDLDRLAREMHTSIEGLHRLTARFEPPPGPTWCAPLEPHEAPPPAPRPPWTVALRRFMGRRE